ncbi:MAG: thrombospondin type 3 repeat-containing protein [Myxococcota bacterium]|nr:thrombospondin type 3 repeat-containing protein [Myxococcota bacterium]
MYRLALSLGLCLLACPSGAPVDERPQEDEPVDLCPELDALQLGDRDGDGFGDACDPCPDQIGGDDDGDGVCITVDNCPELENPSQADFDGDGKGDPCDPCPADVLGDTDGDGVCDSTDLCPDLPNPEQGDEDGDGIGDACDGDNDGDSRDDLFDNCPDVWNLEQEDFDRDGIGDACDLCPRDRRSDVRAEVIPFNPRPSPDAQLDDLGDDGLSPPIPLPFDFVFFGEPIDAVRVSSNGFIVLGEEGEAGHARPRRLPHRESPSPAVYGYWLDLDPRESGRIAWDIRGEMPEREFHVAWEEVPHFRGSEDAGPVSLQIVLSERDQSVEIHCLNCVPKRPTQGATQGVQGQGGRAARVTPGGNYRRFRAIESAVRFVKGSQPDLDEDGEGDACDEDRDGDGIPNADDLCPDHPDPEQLDSDEDGLGNACNETIDRDRDGFADAIDRCPRTPNPEQSLRCVVTTLSGVISVEDQVLGPSGFTGELAPVSLIGLPLQVLNQEDEVIAETVTDEAGRYSVGVEQVGEESYRLRVEAVLPGRISVHDRSNYAARYALESESFTLSPENRERQQDLLATADSPAGGAFHILEATSRGERFVRRFTQESASSLHIAWAPLSPFDCGSCYSSSYMMLGGGIGDPDEFDDDVILHEFGHYFVHQWSHDDSPGGRHNGDPTDPRLAYGEGVATFFAAMVSGVGRYRDNRDDSTTVRVLELLTGRDNFFGTEGNTLDGLISEYAVAAVMYDAYDDSGDSEAHDQLALGDEGSMRILLEGMGADRETDIGFEGDDLADWLNQAACLEVAPLESLEALCEHRRVPWPPEDGPSCDGKATEGPLFRLDRVDDRLVLSGDHKGPSYWQIEQHQPGAWQGSLECAQLPCTLSLAIDGHSVVVARRLDGPGRTEWAGARARAKAQYGALAFGDNGAVRVYRAR